MNDATDWRPGPDHKRAASIFEGWSKHPCFASQAIGQTDRPQPVVGSAIYWSSAANIIANRHPVSVDPNVRCALLEKVSRLAAGQLEGLSESVVIQAAEILPLIYQFANYDAVAPRVDS